MAQEWAPRRSWQVRAARYVLSERLTRLVVLGQPVAGPRFLELGVQRFEPLDQLGLHPLAQTLIVRLVFVVKVVVSNIVRLFVNPLFRFGLNLLLVGRLFEEAGDVNSLFGTVCPFLLDEGFSP